MDFCQIKSKINYNNLSFNQYKYYICGVNKKNLVSLFFDYFLYPDVKGKGEQVN